MSDWERDRAPAYVRGLRSRDRDMCWCVSCTRCYVTLFQLCFYIRDVWLRSLECGAKPRRWTCNLPLLLRFEEFYYFSSRKLVSRYEYWSTEDWGRLTMAMVHDFLLFYCVKGQLRPFSFSLSQSLSLDRLVSNLKLLMWCFVFRWNQGCKKHQGWHGMATEPRRSAISAPWIFYFYISS